MPTMSLSNAAVRRFPESTEANLGLWGRFEAPASFSIQKDQRNRARLIQAAQAAGPLAGSGVESHHHQYLTISK